MFKIENHVPEYYLKESRDFQLFPRLDDVLFLGQHYDISTINELNNPKKCKNSYLKYLAEKVGFYTDKYIPDKVLINIISAFRTALKGKGTLKGVEQAVIAILKAENSVDPPKIIITKEETNDEWEKYTINIYTPIKIVNEVALKEFLKYIIPSGYNYNIYPYDDAKLDGNIVKLNGINQINYIITSPSNIGIVRKDTNEFSASAIANGYDIPYEQLVQDRLIGIADIGIIVNPKDVVFLKEQTANQIDHTTVNTQKFIYFINCDNRSLPSTTKLFFEYVYNNDGQGYKKAENTIDGNKNYYYCKYSDDENKLTYDSNGFVTSNIVIQNQIQQN